MRRFLGLFTCLVALGISTARGAAATGSPAAKPLELAAQLSLTGDASTFGAGSLEGIQLAVEEANADGSSPRIELKVYDDRSEPKAARELAARIAATPAAAVVGPDTSVTSLAGGPAYAAAGLASITTTATSDAVTDNATTFRILFKNSEQGEMLGTYLSRVLGQKRAGVIVLDDTYGQTLEKGFRVAAERLGIEATYYYFKSGEDLESMALAAAPELAKFPVVLAMSESDGAKLLPTLRRLEVNGPFLAANALAVRNFNDHFAELREEKERPGYFCENLYAITPMLLDAANAEMLAFAERCKARHGHYPGWVAVSGYDAARLAIQALRGSASGNDDAPAQRAAVLKFLRALHAPPGAPRGLLGPYAFDAARGRQTAMRFARFSHGRIESAPLQLLPVLSPHEADLKSGAVFEMGPGKYCRLKQVIYSGLFVNEIMWIDQAHFTFAADFYVWLRFAKNSAPGAADPTEIKFPDLSAGKFDREHPVEYRELPDGTSYYLWRVQGEFRNPFDLHRYPFDRETLELRFVNARAAADRIVYVLDLDASQGPDMKDAAIASGASEDAFRSLTQWNFTGTHQSRENFVAKSSLGDPYRMGRENFRELSGYVATIDLQRRWLPTLTKSLLPLLLMTCILYASLHFPPILVQPKIGVAMTAVLTGVVLLNLVNTQLGSIGYTVAVEYAFYVYFALGLLQIVSALLIEHLREVGRPALGQQIAIWSRVVFVAAVGGTAVAAFLYKSG